MADVDHGGGDAPGARGTRPARRALLIAGAYAALGGLYIVISTFGVAVALGEVTRATRIEVTKGLGFFAVTSVVLYFASRTVLSRAERDARDRRPADLDLDRSVRETLDLIRNHPAVRDLRVAVEARAEPRVRGQPVLIRQLVANLVINAAEAAGRGGTVIARIDADDAGAILEVHDDGPGIDPDTREHLFEAFVTTKPNGTGLGLVSCKMVAEAHGGAVEVLDSPGGGACLRVRLTAA